MRTMSLLFIGVLLLAAPAASAENVNVDATVDVDGEIGGESVDETAGVYLVVDDHPNVGLWQETNGCDGLQKEPAPSCEEADKRWIPSDEPLVPPPPG